MSMAPVLCALCWLPTGLTSSATGGADGGATEGDWSEGGSDESASLKLPGVVLTSDLLCGSSSMALPRVGDVCAARNLSPSSTVGTMQSGHAGCSTRCSILTMLTSALPTMPVGLRIMAFPRISRSMRSPVSLAKAMKRRTCLMPGTGASRKSHITSRTFSGLLARLTIRSFAAESAFSRLSLVSDAFLNFTCNRDVLPSSVYVIVAKGSSMSMVGSIGGHEG
mmetsp:Transcript_77741/g.180359  ORF Transcript_77741/g.180359 Transcript_77741/m.180359 type:complete len:223 (+) Transcript_77741:486-1154(+)